MPDNVYNPNAAAFSKVASINQKKWFSFFCCGTVEEKDNRPALNPVPDTTKLKRFTNQEGESVTAFFVVQAVKKGDFYQTPIKYVSPQAEALLKSNELVGRDLASLIPDPSFSQKHSLLIGNFFENFIKSGKNPSDFMGKGLLHGLRNFPVRLLNGEEVRLNFTLDHTIKTDVKTKKPCFYVIAHLPTDLEIQIAQQNARFNAGNKSIDVISSHPIAQVKQSAELSRSTKEQQEFWDAIPGMVRTSG